MYQCRQRGLWLSNIDEEQSEEWCNGVLERESNRLTNGAHCVSPSVSGSFQDDNLCSAQLPAPHSGFCGFHYTALIAQLTLLLLCSLPISPSLLLSLINLPHFQPDSGPGPLLVAGYEDGSLLLWDVTQRSELSQAKAHPEPVMCLTFDTKRLRGISGSSEKNLSSWTLDRQSNLQVSRAYRG